MGSLLACSYVVTVSGSAVLSLVIGLLIVSILINKKTAIKYGLSILLLGILYPFILPSKNSAALTEFASIYEQGSISHNYRRILTILGDLDRFTFVNKSIGKNSLKISSDVYLSGKMPPIREGEGFKDMDGKTHVKNRYLEMQASLNLLSENFLLGVGLGNFQNVIGTYYRELPKVNTKEPNQHNGYLIIAATTGILGLAAFVWIFIYLFSLNYKKLRTSIDLPDKMIYLGLMGSVVAIMIESCFSYIFAASLLVPFIFINYLSVRNITETNDL
jgi:O-antigen ligase